MAPPPPRRYPASVIFAAAALASSIHAKLLEAASDGDLRLLKRLVRALDNGREVVEAVRVEDGVGLLHVAAMEARLEVCRYLVEQLGFHVDDPSDDGITPLICAIHSKDVAVVKYLLDHGADKDKVDHDGLAPLHSAAGIGHCEVVELLLARGAYIDPVGAGGTPLHIAAMEGQAGTMKILLDHHADCNKTDISGMTPLCTALNAASVECVKLLVKAGADVKADSILTALIDATNDNNGSAEFLNCILEASANCHIPDDTWAEHVNGKKIAQLKLLGSKAVERKDYLSASGFYSKAINLDPEDATLFSNRSLCWLRMGDAQKALLDALECREIRPDWPKACYRQGAALMLLKDYRSACEALFDGFKLDPGNAEIEHALREAMESLKTSQGSKAE
ncbi:hypothetical protein ACP70R_027080 [Stipagrostis hirtigluma subsp. patula]